MSERFVNRRHADGVAWITIDRTAKLNALNASVIEGLEEAFAAASDDPEVRVVVLTGAGDKAFVAGADIGELQGLDSASAAALSRRGHGLMNRIENLGKPVIAALNGYALGGGCELALACTVRVASSRAMLGLPEAKLGLMPGYGGTQRLARLAGSGRALFMMLTGEPVTAQQALEYGLVSWVVEPQELEARVAELAGRLAAGAPLAMQAIMHAVNRGADLPLAEGLELETGTFAGICESRDAREGTSAFLEKRKPDFRGE